MDVTTHARGWRKIAGGTAVARGIGLSLAVAVAAAQPATAAPDVRADFVEISAFVGNGPLTLTEGVSGTYTFRIGNYGYTASSLEFFIIYMGTLDQTGQIIAPGFDCEVRHDSGINAAVRCTSPNVAPSTSFEVIVQGRGIAKGSGRIGLVLNPGRTADEADYNNNNKTLDIVVH